MLGLNREKIRLEEDGEYKQNYHDEVSRLKSLIGDKVEGFEHIGSTAIEGIKAKPIIDILVLVDSLEKSDEIVQSLEDKGYDHRDIGEERRVFLAKGPRDNRTHHLSITEKGSEVHEKTVKFRDYLNNHSEKAREYEELKEKLAEKYPEDREKYTEGKKEFVEEVLKEA